LHYVGKAKIPYLNTYDPSKNGLFSEKTNHFIGSHKIHFRFGCGASASQAQRQLSIFNVSSPLYNIFDHCWKQNSKVI
jgi:hypothetical protein